MYKWFPRATASGKVVVPVVNGQGSTPSSRWVALYCYLSNLEFTPHQNWLLCIWGKSIYDILLWWQKEKSDTWSYYFFQNHFKTEITSIQHADFIISKSRMFYKNKSLMQNAKWPISQSGVSFASFLNKFLDGSDLRVLQSQKYSQFFLVACPLSYEYNTAWNGFLTKYSECDLQ